MERRKVALPMTIRRLIYKMLHRKYAKELVIRCILEAGTETLMKQRIRHLMFRPRLLYR